jgi:hypothetical protein
MKIGKLLVLCASCISAIFTGCGREGSKGRPPANLDSLLTPISIIQSAFENQKTDIQVTVKGTVTEILRDDTTGEKHQRFIILMPNNQTILVTHNIDIAPRIPAIAVGDLVYARGEYVWNDRGGILHWTHEDPNHRHEAGWIVVKGEKYQ